MERACSCVAAVRVDARDALSVATLCGTATRRQVVPPFVVTYAAPSPGPGMPWVNVEPTAMQSVLVAHVRALISPDFCSVVAWAKEWPPSEVTDAISGIGPSLA